MTTTTPERHKLDQAIRDHLGDDPYDEYGNAARALLAVLDLHPPIPCGAGWECQHCYSSGGVNADWPCETVQWIADHLLDPLDILVARGFVEVVNDDA